MTNFIDLLGYVAAICTTGAYLPQSLRVWRTRSAEDVSLRMMLLSIAGNTMWLMFGFFTHSMPLIAASVCTVILAGSILVAKRKFGSSD